MIGISGVDGASGESRCDSLWIKTGRALSERVPSGPDCFDPATLVCGEACFLAVLSGDYCVVSFGSMYSTYSSTPPCRSQTTPCTDAKLRAKKGERIMGI